VGERGREYHGMMRSSDLLPTLLAYAGNTIITNKIANLDGCNMEDAIKHDSESPRKEMLLELYAYGDYIFHGEYLHAYRDGGIKLVEGIVHDIYWCSESTLDRMNSTYTSYITPIGSFSFVRWNGCLVLDHSTI
jgi:hypothetical protein